MKTEQHCTLGRAFTARSSVFVAIVVALGVLLPVVHAQAATGSNPVVAENQLPGNANWGLTQSADDLNKQVKGYASATSVNKGASIDFKVTVTPAQNFTIDFFRLGWYQGAGARLVQSVGPLAGITQAACPVDSTTGLIECAWSTSYSLTVPATWTSGVYLARLNNAAGYQNYVPFVVRDDARVADLLYQASFATYQAYNSYPNDGSAQCGKVRPTTGKDLYDNQSSSAATLVGNRAAKVSFDRPYECGGAGDLVGFGWSWEPDFIMWMERNGYDVSYSTDLDTHENGQRLLNYKGWLSAGHDEYWSKQMYDAAETARGAGVHLGFFGSNDVYWQVRFEPSSTGAPDRVLVAYKNTPNNTYTTLDPIADRSLATVRFQDPPVNRPGQLLTGVSFAASTERSTLNTAYRPTNTDNWVYAGTGFAPSSSVPGIVGYEADAYSCHYPLPANTSYATLSSSPIVDGDHFTQNTDAVIYRAPSGAWVFSSSTMSWTWALNDKADPADPTRNLHDSRIETATANLLNAFVGTTSPSDFASSVPPCTYHKQMTFEDGTLVSQTTGANRTIGSVALDGAAPLNGAWSAKFVNATGSWLEDLVTPADDFNLSFSLRLDAKPTVDVRLAAVSSLFTDSVGNLVLNTASDGLTRLQLRNGSTRVGSSSPPLTIGATYRVGLHQRRGSGADGVLEGFVVPAGTSFGAPFAATTTAAFTTRADRVRVGSTTNNATTPPLLNATVDDVTIDGQPATSSSAPPAAPSGLAASASTGAQVTLAWTDNATNESSYEIERSTDGGAWTLLASGLAPNTTTFADNAVNANTAYSYRVRARNANGASDYSNVASLTTPGLAPAAPTNLVAAQVSPTQVSLSWTDNSNNETSFQVERSSSAAFTNVAIVSLAADSTSYSDTVAEGVVWYRVRAFAGSAPSQYSNVVTGSRVKDMTFESGSLSGPAGADKVAGTVTASSSAPLKGSFSARIPLGTTGAYLEQAFGPVGEVFTSYYMRLDALPAVDNRVAQILHGTGGSAVTSLTLWIRANGTLQLKNYNTTIGSGPVLAAGTTYRVGLHEKMLPGGLLQLEAFVAVGDQPFGAPFASTSSAIFSSTTGAGTIRIGSTLGSGGLAATIDDIKIDTAFMPSASP